MYHVTCGVDRVLGVLMRGMLMVTYIFFHKLQKYLKMFSSMFSKTVA